MDLQLRCVNVEDPCPGTEPLVRVSLQWDRGAAPNAALEAAAGNALGPPDALVVLILPPDVAAAFAQGQAAAMRLEPTA